ncbi:tRNA-splicing endonuclease subunit Sen15p [[Candida] jaroonii]|uniref:tRNA-splicing endonuclease subunit Sen15p n=1 Tax=[Candida] jaroonii TaxID=467808 RepID=A0ACA9YCW7_9ASCO|nr:tRNA-splicing endonuclease subunit Sen15p [[Candida] jaroonii]
MSLASKVKTNLQYQNLWTNVTIHQVSDLEIVSGIPPNKLSSVDEENQVEWIIPKMFSQDKLSVSEIQNWFSKILELSGDIPRRITIAIINDDSTIVYYFIHNGITKPNQN